MIYNYIYLLLAINEDIKKLEKDIKEFCISKDIETDWIDDTIRIIDLKSLIISRTILAKDKIIDNVHYSNVFVKEISSIIGKDLQEHVDSMATINHALDIFLDIIIQKKISVEKERIIRLNNALKKLLKKHSLCLKIYNLNKFFLTSSIYALASTILITRSFELDFKILMAIILGTYICEKIFLQPYCSIIPFTKDSILRVTNNAISEMSLERMKEEFKL